LLLLHCGDPVLDGSSMHTVAFAFLPSEKKTAKMRDGPNNSVGAMPAPQEKRTTKLTLETAA